MPSAVTLTIRSLSQSTSFYLSALQPLDYVYRGRTGDTIGFGLKDSPPDFWISQEVPGIPSGAVHVAFPASSQRNVQDFFVAALKAGGKCRGEPLLREPESGYYSAAVIDFDGNSIEAVFRPNLLDEGYGSRPSSISSVSSVKTKPAMSSKTPTIVSRASAIKAPSEARSVAPSHTGSRTSKAPASVSRSNAQSEVSRAPSHISRAPTSVSRSTSQQEIPQAQTMIQTLPSGETVTTFISEAKGAINVAREIVSHVRPALNTAGSAPDIRSTTQDLSSHKPSDTIVGTLLGVAAGAALHYAYTKVTESDKPASAQAVESTSYRPPIARTNTEPSFADERMYYYHQYRNTPTDHPYAIEAPPSEYSRLEPSRVGSQRYITMVDTDERLSTIAPSTVRPRRRSSFSGVDVRSFTAKSKASHSQKSTARALEGPPSAYRAPTATTQIESESRVSRRSRSKSRVSSNSRSMSTSGESKASRRADRRSDEDIRSSARSHTSRRSSSKHGSRAPSAALSERTVIPARSTTANKAPSHAPSRSSTIKPEDRPLPPSRAGTTVSASPTEYMSTHSKSNRTVIGKMLERERTGRNELTKSVVGKIEDSEKLNVSSREVDPSDSVSQVSSVRSKKSSRR